jgi:cell division protein DivIC
MADVAANKAELTNRTEEKVSLTVVPPAPGEQDIRVEVKRQMSSGKKRSQRRFAGFLLAVMLLMLFPMLRDGLSYLRMRQALQTLQQQNRELLSAKEQLARELLDLSDPEVIEKLAREELNMVRPGESKVFSAIPTDDIPEREKLRTGEALH